MMNLDTAQEQIRAHLAYLVAEGFVPLAEHTQQSALLGDFLTLPYANVERQRTLEVHLSSGRGQRSPAIAVMVSAPHDRRVALHDWLRLHPEIDPLPELDERDPIGSLAAYCGRLKDILLGPFKAVLSGTAWDDAPPDWQGLR